MPRDLPKDASLAEELPYWEFSSGPFPHVVLSDGSLTSGFALELKDIESLDANSINQFSLGLRSALNGVSENVTLQLILSVDSDFSEILNAHRSGWMSDAHSLVRKLAKARLEGLEKEQEDGLLYRPSLIVLMRVAASPLKKAGFLKKQEAFQAVSEANYRESLEELNQNLSTLSTRFHALGLNSRSLEKEDMIRCVYRSLNPKRSLAVPPPKLQSPSNEEIDSDSLKASPWLANSSPREQLVFGDLLLDYDQFTLGGYHHRVITLKTLPEQTYAGMLSAFLRLPFHYDLILSIQVPPQAGEMARLNQRRRMAHSLAVTHGNRASDLESESKLSSTEELIRELLNTGQRIYAVQLTLVLRAPHGVEGRRLLDRQVREVLARFRSLSGAEGLEEGVGSWKIFKGVLPFAPVHLERARKMKTNNLADFLPVYGPREGDSDPAVLFRNRLGGLVSFNHFDPGLPNFNCLVTGSSGAGKSFANNCIVLQELARNLRVFIVDVGGSYRKLTEAIGGQYLDVNLTNGFCVNPFALADQSSEPSAAKIKSLLSICELMIAEDEQTRLSKLDRVLLEKTLIELYAEKRKSGQVPVLSDLANTLSRSTESSLSSLGKLLYPWTGNRPYGRLLDGNGQLRADARVCTFDLKGLSNYPDLQSVMILILTDFILSEVERDQGHQKRIILDEAWQFLKSPVAANFMEYCARTLRKSGSGITFITQGVEEIIQSPIGPAILNNTATKLIMLQKSNPEVLREALRLNPQELALIGSLEKRMGEFSEGFLIEGDARQVIRICPSPMEYWLSTSDAPDNRFLQELMEAKKLTLIEGLEMASARFPWGVAAGERAQVAG